MIPFAEQYKSQEPWQAPEKLMTHKNLLQLYLLFMLVVPTDKEAIYGWNGLQIPTRLLTGTEPTGKFFPFSTPSVKDSSQ